MTPPFPPEQLDCPDKAHCPVLPTLPELGTTKLVRGRLLHRVYDSTWGHDEHNPGFGDARFSPFDHPHPGNRVPTMYLADDPKAALLETIFHDVHHTSARTVYEQDLVGKLLAYLRVTDEAILGDLRNAELGRLGIARDSVVSSSAEHYPCTRRLAVQALSRHHGGLDVQGLIWHSRQAELAGQPDVEVLVLFGSRYSSRRGGWNLFAPGVRNLYEGAGRLLIDELADELDATLITGV